jgi:hypothetical protein
MPDLDSFHPADTSVAVWRYSQLWKLLSALQTQKLHLALLDKLRIKFDPYEASVPASTHTIKFRYSLGTLRCHSSSARASPARPVHHGSDLATTPGHVSHA